ncbi:creatininase family protein [Demetria terragena]|uniref:creatininase family protein n=1 Tax=Demetria terragena TaxID=63959 RepID=UPI0003A44B0F|nr:creatininase family protein [Demetria terragena]
MTNRLAEMTTREAGVAAQQDALVVIPAGAYEQHGPAMPMATDTIRAEAVAARLADEVGDQILIGPSIPVGVSPHHRDFAGTVTLSTATFAAVLTDYIDSLAHHGFRRFLVITGHGGNNATLGATAHDLLRTHPDVEFAWVAVSALAKDAIGALGVSEVHGHCGEAETAQMLCVAPELVRNELLEPGATTLAEMDPLARLSRAPGVNLSLAWGRLTSNGVLGDPTRVTPADGERIISEAVATLTHIVTEWAAA